MKFEVPKFTNEYLFEKSLKELYEEVVGHFLRYKKPKKIYAGDFNSVEKVFALTKLTESKLFDIKIVDMKYYLEYEIKPTAEGVAQYMCDNL